MCYRSNARPPLPPIAGGAGAAASTTEIVLTAADGNSFAAFSAVTDRPDAPGMVILPDIRGLHPFYQDLAVRFGEAGVHAVAFDYFGRTAGVGARDEDFDHMPHVRATEPDTVAADVAAAVAHVRSPEGGRAPAVFSVGFCFGGRASFNQAARGHGLAGAIGFYGRVAPADGSDGNAPVLLAARYTCPILGLFGGDDRSISRGDVEAFRGALVTAGVENELVVYDGAPHSFFDRSFAEHADACDDAWRRILGFVERHGRGGP